MEVLRVLMTLTNSLAIITSSSDKKEMVCIKRKSFNCSTRKEFLEKAVVNFDEKSYRECLKIAKSMIKNLFRSTNMYIILITYLTLTVHFPITRSVRYQPILHTLYFTLHCARILNNVVLTTVMKYWMEKSYSFQLS